METTLVHLANLPKTIAVTELIGRLESLEQRIAGKSGAATMHDRRASAPVAERNPPLKPETIGGGAETTVLKIPSDKPPEHHKRSNSWEEFLAFVGTEKRFLSPYLESAIALGLPPEPLKISIGERYHLAFWQDDENLAALKGLAKRFFSSEVTLQIVGAPSYESSSAATAANLSTKPDDERSPMVKEALRIFGGSVRNVRRENG